YFKKFLPLLDHLHDHATARDKAGNRTLHYDQYIALQLIFFFNPIVTSMRGLVQASALRKARRELGVLPTSLVLQREVVMGYPGYTRVIGLR
ncbi:MAG: hypothetical protein GVY16_10925, partial [Planctomycetes bacterium]|nr:hypothetical protein [Planctomycetota bacterium]